MAVECQDCSQTSGVSTTKFVTFAQPGIPAQCVGRARGLKTFPETAGSVYRQSIAMHYYCRLGVLSSAKKVYQVVSTLNTYFCIIVVRSINIDHFAWLQNYNTPSCQFLRRLGEIIGSAWSAKFL